MGNTLTTHLTTAYFALTPHLLISMPRDGITVNYVVHNGLPADAKLVGVDVIGDGQELHVWFESATLHPYWNNKRIPPPMAIPLNESIMNGEHAL